MGQNLDGLAAESTSRGFTNVHLCLFCLRPVSSFGERDAKAATPLLLQKEKNAIAWKRMPEWSFEFLEGPITEMRPTEPRQPASGAATRR